MKTRDITIDIMRTISIFLIVMGHVYICNALYDWFYIQVFFFISGIFFNYRQGFNDGICRIARTIIVPYIVFALVCSALCLIAGRTVATELHLYDPDSFDNGPQWFLITLAVLEFMIIGVEKIKITLIRYVVYAAIFIISYWYACKGYDDYTNWVKAGISLPFFLSGRLYKNQRNRILNYRFLIFSISLVGSLIVIFNGCNMCFRVLQIPHNILEYLALPTIGILLLLSLLLIISDRCKIFERNFMLNTSLVGKYSLFILCLHWPVLQVIRKIFNIDGNILGFFVSIALCCICTIAGYYLTKHLPYIFNPYGRK